MSLTPHAKQWHEKYANLDPTEQDTINLAFDAVVAVFKRDGVDCAMDDRAETLIAAITEYALTSMKG